MAGSGDLSKIYQKNCKFVVGEKVEVPVTLHYKLDLIEMFETSNNNGEKNSGPF